MSDLSTAYLNAVSLWRELRQTIPQLSAPLVISPAKEYDDATVRLLVVGQETFGWGEGIDCAQPDERIVDILAEWYRSFDLGAKYRSTPFWAAANQIFHLLNSKADSRAFLWSNLVKMDSARHRVSPQVEDRIAALQLLQLEISTFRPEVVIFFTGPRYDARLLASFPGVTLEPTGQFLARVVHTSLPRRTYRTYHPRYLRMSRHWDVIADLASRCKLT